ACPTKAFVAPFQLNAERCISYWTIEHRGAIPDAIKPELTDYLFGCDVCQEVCPWNHAKDEEHTTPKLFAPREKPDELLEALLASTPKRFLIDYNGRPFRRAGWAGMIRNAAVVIGNLRLKKYRQTLRELEDKLPKEDAWLKNEIDW